jgi:protocatechuate 3,4-dioxygenase beta subunit
MIVSGRILGPGGKPLAGAAVDASQAGASGLRAGAITDADGRFILTRSACTEQDGRPQSISCRVSHPKHATLQTSLDFARAQLQRDESGVWRAAIGLTLS